MDLELKGRNAIVCASSRGLGQACAFALAEAGCTVVVNGRDAKTLGATAREMHGGDRRHRHPGGGGRREPAGQRALVDAVSHVDILVNNNGGPPMRDFREIDRDGAPCRRHRQHGRRRSNWCGR